MDMITYWNRYCAPFLRARLARGERGASMVEYALLVALIAVVCIGAVTLIGNGARNALSSAGTTI
jgi:pilus assembly protein Flp/PilA